ncbi:MAG: hypothetical protein OEV28_06055 [Nitrospirota bacterium]|nr:hypothetical protein [Nitrospirota bacterium]
MQQHNWLVRALDLAGTSLPAIRSEVGRMLEEHDLRCGGTKPRRYLAYGVSSRLISRAAFKTGAFGGLVSAPAILPGIGTIGTLFVGITADFAYLTKQQIELCYGISAAYEVPMDEDELQATALALIGFSGSAEAVKGVAVRGLRGVVDELTQRYLETGVADSAVDMSRFLGPRFLGKAHKLIPLIGIPLSASINMTSTMMVGNQARRYFSTWDREPGVVFNAVTEKAD